MSTRTEDCPKCGAVGLRPSYDGSQDKLVYRCGCGYRFTRPTVDSPLRGLSDICRGWRDADTKRSAYYLDEGDDR